MLEAGLKMIVGGVEWKTEKKHEIAIYFVPSS